MNLFKYYVSHVFPTGWQTVRGTFRIWKDLMTNNYNDYALLKDDDPFAECRDWFWCSLNEDDVYPKEFLEYLIQLADDVDSGKVKTYPMTSLEFEELDSLLSLDNLEDNENGN